MLTTADAARMCPACGGDSYVYKTYDRPDGARIRRRRCLECGTRYETIEIRTRTLGKKNKKHG